MNGVRLHLARIGAAVLMLISVAPSPASVQPRQSWSGARSWNASRPLSPFAARSAGGMGAASVTTPQLIGTTGAVAGSLFGTLMAVPGLAAAIGILPGVGIAIGAGVAAITGILSALGVGGGCGQSCIQASNDANQIEAQMKANLAAYQAGQIDGPTARANFLQLWQGLVQACGQIGGGAGQNCVADRQAGACKWKDSSGACWNWQIGYLDPIDAGTSPTSASSALSWLSNLSTLEMLGLAVAGGWAVAEVL